MRTCGPVLACVLAIGCGLRPYTDGSASGEGTSSGTSTGDETLGGSVTGAVTSISASSSGVVEETGDESTSGEESSTGGEGETCGPQGEDSGMGGIRLCDQWVQDCPEGCKCMPFSGDGDNSWESLKCTPVMPNAGGHGEPCTVEGSGVSGIDSCAEGYMCWFVDPETGAGTCVEQCKGAPDMPSCTEPWTACTIYADGVLTLCLPFCDPLDVPCPNDELCIPNSQDPNSFICVPDASGQEGQVFDACEYSNACDPGLLCANPLLASECDVMAVGCCLPFCDLEAPVCPGVGQECLAWYEEGQAPPMLENVGVCGIPQ